MIMETGDGIVEGSKSCRIIQRGRYADGSKKYLLSTAGGRAAGEPAAGECATGERVEAIAVPLGGSIGISFSTQVGCAMGCTFCMTGRSGFVRNLNATEIVKQVVWVQADCDKPLVRLDTAGQGEPLENTDALLEALTALRKRFPSILSDTDISVVSCGVVPGLYNLNSARI
jgi:23S rRNA (adenine2503-C2)-methyltransferase